jgi:hypothetical protein
MTQKKTFDELQSLFFRPQTGKTFTRSRDLKSTRTGLVRSYILRTYSLKIYPYNEPTSGIHYSDSFIVG